MASYTAIHVKSDKLKRVENKLLLYIRSKYQKDFIAGPISHDFSNGFPTELSTFQHSDGFVHILYNSWETLSDIAEFMSTEKLVIQVHAQTTSDAYRVAVYENGQVKRVLEFADDWIEQSGTAFAFESNPLGSNIAGEGEDPIYIFGLDDLQEFCQSLGCDVWPDLPENVNTFKLNQPIKTKSPWWKFW